MSRNNQLKCRNTLFSTSLIFFVYSQDPLLQRLSIADLRLNPLHRKNSKGQVNANHQNNAQYHHIGADNAREFQEINSVGKKGSFDSFNNQDHVLHAPEVLQPVRRFAKSRNDSRLEENSLLEMKLNALSPEPLRPILSFKSKSEFEHGDYRYKSSFKDGFL